MSAEQLPVPNLQALGWSDRWRALFDQCLEGASESLVPGRVTRVDRGAVIVSPGGRRVPIRPGADVAVGDWVALEADRPVIAAVLPRSGTMQRRDPDRDEAQTVAANVDIVLAVCGLDRPVRRGRIDRVATQAWDAGAVPLVVLTKADLADDVEQAVDEARNLVPLVDVLVTSAATAAGLEQLRSRIAGHTVVLVGESGSGKSSLLNALDGGASAATGGVRSGDAKGRHTTTRRELYALTDGTVIIDTPGVRAMGLWVDPQAVQATYTDIDELGGDCRFRDCRHTGEPGCAVAAAVAAGGLAPERLTQFLRLRSEAENLRVRRDAAARHALERQFGRLRREAKRHDKRR